MVVSIVVVFILFSIFLVAVLEMPDMNKVFEPRRLKKKYHTLQLAYKDLHKDYDRLKQDYEVLETEVIAHRNKLPWIDIEELNGPQE